MTNEQQPTPQHPEGLTLAQEVVANELFEIGAIKFGAFRLKLHEKNPDAPLSPYYVDLRILPRYPSVLSDAADMYKALVKFNAHGFDTCLGIPDAANPLATAFALKTETPQIYMRKAEKTGHGISGLFMTPFEPEEQVLLIDDLVTKADSKLETIEALKEVGLKVADVVVLVDREQGGAKQLADAGYNLLAVFQFSQLLDFYHRTGQIDDAKYQEAKAYLEASQKS
jgi:uridine monophosphate synthetase